METVFGSLNRHQHGRLDIIDDDPRRYAFSNLFELASKSDPYQKIAVAKNFEYVLEALRADGVSPWWATPHDEFALVMDGEIEIELLDPSQPVCEPEGAGAVELTAAPEGKPMGRVRARRGHMTLLPAARCYRFRAIHPGVILLQTIGGAHTEYRWSEICDGMKGRAK